MVKIRKIEVKNVAKQVFRLDFCGRGLTVETGEVAKQAGGAVLVRYDDTVVLSTATASKQAKEGIDFFPLTVLFEEKLYSVGKIPGGFLRREGRPSEHATLTGTVRFRHPVQRSDCRCNGRTRGWRIHHQPDSGAAGEE